MIREFLEQHDQVSHVFFPEIDGQQLQGYACILFFSLVEPFAEAYRAFSERLTLFATGTAMAAVTSTVAQPYSGSHASMSDEEKAAMKLGPELVRLCIGLEDPEDLKADLTQAFDYMRMVGDGRHGAK